MTTSSDADVYGDAFALYRTKMQEFDTFTKFFKDRLAANNIDHSIFKDKVCLDAGCGGGRGSIFMLSAGAKKVTGVDLSQKNIETSRAMAKLKKYDNAEFVVGDVHNLPFEDQQFDIVWCNGVLHHTDNTDLGLVEVTRVLKTGGSMWLYLYGAGGVEWAVVDEIRDNFIQSVPFDTCLQFLQIIEDHLGSVSEFLDNWYTPNLKRYTHHDVQARLGELGFPDAKRLIADVGDRTIDLNKSSLLGEQNLRYFVKKEFHAEPSQNAFCLPDVNDKGSAYSYSDEIQETVRSCQIIYNKLVDYEKKHSRNEPFLRTAIARAINKLILVELEKGDLKFATLKSSLESITSSLDGIAST
jgi:ubiquinone/menaquinone biosynthesis C-methylase UbiE